MEIIKYFKDQGVTDLVFHPVYQDLNKRIPEHLIPSPEEFVPFYLRSWAWARNHNINLMYSGVRLYQKHNQFCLPLQRNLSITPDGYLTFCFLATDNYKGRNDDLMYGHIDNNLTVIDRQLGEYVECLQQPFDQCMDCWLKDHCSKGCPDICPIRHDPRDAFDCRINKWIGTALLLEQKDYMLMESDFENPRQMVHTYQQLIPKPEFK